MRAGWRHISRGGGQILWLVLGAVFSKDNSNQQGAGGRVKEMVHGLRGAGGVVFRWPIDLYKPRDEGLFEGVGSEAQIILDVFFSFQHQGGVGGEGDEEVDEGQHGAQGRVG